MDTTKPWFSGRRLRVLNAASWAALIAVQAGVPLDFSSDTLRRIDTPITPAGFAFSIWGVIFLLQGVAVVVPWWSAASEWSHPALESMGLLWPLTWALQCCWTLSWALQQRVFAGHESVLLCWMSGGFLLASHVTVSLALKRAVGAVQQLQAGAQEKGEKMGLKTLAALCALYILPSGLNAGWLGLASCLGILHISLLMGAAYEHLIKPGMAMLAVAVASLAAQPWRPLPGVRDLTCVHEAKVLVPAATAMLSYAAAVGWGLFGILRADRPTAVQHEVLLLLPLVKVTKWAAFGIRAWWAHKHAPPLAEEEEPSVENPLLLQTGEAQGAHAGGQQGEQEEKEEAEISSREAEPGVDDGTLTARLLVTVPQ